MKYNDLEEEMLRRIDVAAIAQEFGEHPITTVKSAKKAGMSIQTKANSTRCKKTGKVQFADALIAIEALRQWQMKDPDMCWDIKRLRVYKCKKCHQFHLGKI